MSSSVQFGREAEVIIANNSYSMSEFKIEFIIEFDDDPEPNIGKIKIYNLSQNTINQIKTNQNVILNAGYTGDVGTIFAGSIAKATNYRQRTDKILELQVGDAISVWLNAYANKTYKAGIRASQVVSDMLGLFGLEIGAFELAEDKIYLNGMAVFGSLQSILKKIVVQDCKSKFHISNGVVMVRKPDTGAETGFLLNADTGLIESPSKIESSKNKADYSVQCLLNHRLKTDSLLQIESMSANGVFRTIKGRHIGSDSDDFVTEIEVKSVG